MFLIDPKCMVKEKTWSADMRALRDYQFPDKVNGFFQPVPPGLSNFLFSSEIPISELGFGLNQGQ